MILVIIPIFVVLAAASWFLISSKVLKSIFGTIFTIGAVASIGLLSANMDSHYGMKKETTNEEGNDRYDHTSLFSCTSTNANWHGSC